MIDNEILEQVNNQIFNGKQFYLKTGFEDLDVLLSNVEKSDLITIGGRPSMGKTAFATSMMFNLLAQNKKCLYFSFELGSSSFIKRLISNLTGIDPCSLNTTNKLSPKQFEKIASAIEKISQLNLFLTDKKCNLENIQKKIEENKPDYVFIDAIQYIDIDLSNVKNFNNALSKVIISLKNIAKENNCVIFMTSQLSRALEARCDKRPMLSDLRNCGAIEECSDVVMLVYREEYYNKEDIGNRGHAEIIVAKNKNGFVGSVDLVFNNQCVKFVEPLCKNIF